jgi:hypothetical protein
MGASVLSTDDALNTKFQLVYTATGAKLSQYYAPDDEAYIHGGGAARFTQRALPLLKATRAFDPSKVPYLDSPVQDLQPLPGFNQAAQIEFKIFEQQCQELAVTQAGLIPYWKSVKERFPVISRLALRYLSVPPGSVDAERSFSARGSLLTPQRLALSQENRSHLTLHVNSKFQK